MKGGGMAKKKGPAKKMRGGGMATKKMRGGGMAAKRMRGGGMAKKKGPAKRKR
tara:strand:- start:2598 stop:2756 length:159 start_codon:yes stop_codon:yes gene_type:complete